MNNEQLISVVMPAYNAAAFIGKSIASVQQQTYTNWELLIVDDGSADNTAAIVKEIMKADNRIQYFYQQNGKQAKARNRGIRESSGNIVAFIDADDTWMKNKLESQSLFMQSTNADLVFADTNVVDEKGKAYMDSWGVTDAVYTGDTAVVAFMQDNKAPLLTVMAKKACVVNAGGFDEAVEMQYVEDYDLWLRMLQQGASFASSKEKLACYRFDTNRTAERKISLINVIGTLRKISVNDVTLKQQKNAVMTLWTRRIVKRCAPAIERHDMKKIITLLPSPLMRNFLGITNNIFGANAAGKMILLFTRALSLSQVKQ